MKQRRLQFIYHNSLPGSIWITKRIMGLSLLFIMLLGASTLVNAQQPNFEWAKGIGGPGRVGNNSYGASDQGFSIAADDSGNVYITGSYDSTVDFDPGPGVYNLTAPGNLNFDIYVLKLNAAGGFVWAKSMGGSGLDVGRSIALDATGNIYVTGWLTNDTIDFDPGPGVYNLSSNGLDDIFVLKLNSAGNFKWARTMGGTASDEGWSVGIDPQGNVYTTGNFTGTADFDPGISYYPISAASISSDVFISKLDSNGNFKWAKGFGGKGLEYANAIAVSNKTYNVYLTGQFDNRNGATVDFNPSTNPADTFFLPGFNFRDIFVEKLDSAGNFKWAVQMGGQTVDWGQAIAVDNEDNVYSTGYFGKLADFNPSLNPADTFFLTGTGTYNTYISKLDSAGHFVWAGSFPQQTLYTNNGWGIAVDVAKNVYLTGMFNGSVDFNPLKGVADTFFVASKGDYDIYIAKLDASGKLAWVKDLGGKLGDYGYGIALGKSSEIYTTGYYKDTVDFNAPNNVNLMSNGNNDIFVLKLACGDTVLKNIMDTSCTGGYTFNGIAYNQTGRYPVRFARTTGCDSTVVLNLTVSPSLNVHITVNGFVLGTGLPYTSYQWYVDGQIINGATKNTVNTDKNGVYKVVVTNANGCHDSDSYTVTNVGVNNITAIAQGIKIYPNPATDILHIAASVPVNVSINSIDGKSIMQVNNAKDINIKTLANGLYMARITDANGVLLKTEKIIKTN